jgi:hypothetical protein
MFTNGVPVEMAGETVGMVVGKGRLMLAKWSIPRSFSLY